MANGTLAASQLEMLSQDGTGVTTIVPPATNTNRTLTLPDSTGTLSTLGVGTAVASTSGTSIDFTGIPSWAKKITVMFSGVSLSGTATLFIRVGSGSIATTGYSSIGMQISTAGNAGGGAVTTAFNIGTSSAAADVYYGSVTLSLLGSDVWTATGSLFQDSSTDRFQTTTGAVTLGGTLDQVRVTSSNGTDTFDAGTINIMYEG